MESSNATATRKRKLEDEPDDSERKVNAHTDLPKADNYVNSPITTTNAACVAVFATTELLENILLHAPARTVFVVQRVCRHFRDVLDKSKALKEKLFLIPAGADEPEAWSLATYGAHEGVVYLGLDFEVVRLRDAAHPPPDLARLGGKICGASRPARSMSPLLRMPLPAYGTPFKNRILHSEEVIFEIERPLHCVSGSWKETYLLASATLDWTIDTTPKIRGTTYSNVPRTSEIDSRYKTDAQHGFTMGMLWDNLSVDETVDHVYRQGEGEAALKPMWYRNQRLSLDTLLKRLESEKGRTATASRLMISMHDVVLPTDEERAMVKDA